MLAWWNEGTRRPHALVLLGLVIILAGLLRTAGPLYRLADRTLTFQHVAWQWDQRDLLAGPELGNVAAWLRAPTANLDTPLLWSAEDRDLDRFPGLDPRAALPGEGNLSVVLGHRDAHFRALGNLRSGDSAILETHDGKERWYWVSGIEILPKEELATRLAARADRDLVVLVTCFPLTYMGAAPKRLLIWLEPEPFETGFAVAGIDVM